MSTPRSRDGRLAVGDRVTWRKAGAPHTLGFTGCEIQFFGPATDGREAAMIKIGDELTAAAVEDLHLEYDADPPPEAA